MKVITLLIVFLMSSFCFSQDKEFNFILTIDEVVNPTVTNIKLYVLFEGNERREYSLGYVPGRLTIKLTDYNELIANDLLSTSLYFVHNDFSKKRTSYNHYEIVDFKFSWLERSHFFILYIYNTNKKKYKKLFNPLIGKNFTYEYDSSEGSMRRLTKKNR